MDVGDRQRKLSVWAAQDQDHRFYDLYHLLYDKDWLRLAQRPAEVNTSDNLRTLCIPCHQRKTQEDRQMESGVR